MNILLGVIVGLLVLTFLVVAHEFGHFFMARKNGVRVLEFGIGFPPRAIAWKKGKDNKWHRLPKSSWPKPTEKPDSLILSINWLPIGGFCQMDGETCSDTKKGTFGAASFKQKTKILFGGVAANWLIAILIFMILAWTGMPAFLENQFTIPVDAQRYASTPVTVLSVDDNSPAKAAGFEIGDVFVSVNGQEIISYAESVPEQFAGQTVTYIVKRNDQEIELTPTLNDANSDYLLGVGMNANQTRTRYTWSAPIVAVGTTIQLTGETFKGLGTMLWNLVTGTARQISFNGETRKAGREAISSASESVSGPIGILGTIFPAYVESGLTNIAFLAAVISLSLACMNVLPIPALDGGRWLLIFIYKLKKKPLTKEIEENIVAKAFIILIILMILITIVDIVRLF